MSDLDMDQLAQKLFGATTPTGDKAEATRQATAADRQAATFYGQPVPRLTPEPLRAGDAAKSDEEIAEALYANSPIHGDAERVIKTGVMDQDLIAPEAADAIVAEWVPVFREYGLSATESKMVADIGVGVYSRPPDAETTERWIEQSRNVLQRDFKPDQIAGVLEDAQALVARNPQVKAWLEATGLGNHPDLVRIVAQKAYAMRRAGKFN